MLVEARRRIGETPGDPPIHLVRADARHLPFVGTFALAVCFGALGHFIGVDQDLLIASIARALRPGARFVFISDTKPPILSARFWLAHGFNGAMSVRNALLRRPFVMYYLTFLVPEVQSILARHGFSVEVKELPEGSPDDRNPRMVIGEHLEPLTITRSWARTFSRMVHGESSSVSDTPGILNIFGKTLLKKGELLDEQAMVTQASDFAHRTILRNMKGEFA